MELILPLAVCHCVLLFLVLAYSVTVLTFLANKFPHHLQN